MYLQELDFTYLSIIEITCAQDLGLQKDTIVSCKVFSQAHYLTSRISSLTGIEQG
jgi:hypothetical protein